MNTPHDPADPAPAGVAKVAGRRVEHLRGRRGPEDHRAHRAPWLRASVMGASDGIVSTASLVLGVAAAQATTETIATAGLAGLVGGALSMASGEFVSVAAQRDAEEADLALERWELDHLPTHELEELTQIYVDRGLDPDLAERVATALMAEDALGAHAHDELGIDPDGLARPWLAGGSSAVAFAVGGGLPLALVLLLGPSLRVPGTLVGTLAALSLLGGWSAWLGGAPVARAVVRVVAGGSVAMAVTAAVGAWFGGA